MRNNYFLSFAKIISLFILSGAISSICLAADIDSAQARKYATEFFIQKGWTDPGDPIDMVMVFSPVFNDSANNVQDYAYYVYQVGQRGYVAISAWEFSRTILFYAEGDFGTNVKVEAFQYWIDYYIELMGEKYDEPVKVSKSIVQESKSGEISFSKGPDFVEPLLTTTWNQGCYYNELCPADIDGPCGHVWAGCVAVAMAQIINYHEYPAVGLGTHSYTHPVYGTLTANFAEGYDYSLYPTSISSSNPDLARFLYHCGVSVNMNYGPDGSGASSLEMADALKDHFDYSGTISYLLKDYFLEEDWDSLLIQELINSRPVYYTGSSDGGSGHAFVCDGFDEFGLFHFNLGWGGAANGYYALEDLAYHNNQAAVVYIQPKYKGPADVQDSLALVSLYNTTDGANWYYKRNWLYGNVADWHGITLDSSGRVVVIELTSNNLSGTLSNDVWTIDSLQKLDFYNNHLTGQIPAALNNLIYLKELNLSGNQLSGNIPPEIGDLTSLVDLRLNSNQLSGDIPAEIGNLTSLRNLYLNYNQLTGEIPSEIGNMSCLINVFLNYNQLSGSVPATITDLFELYRLILESNQLSDLPDLSSNSGLQYLFIRNNRFTFEDLEPNIGILYFDYSPQANIGESQSHLLDFGADHLMTVTCGGVNNLYQWLKDGVQVPGATLGVYQITDADISDRGIYTCQVTNTVATDLTIISNPIIIDVRDPGFQADSLALVDLYLSTDGDNWTNRDNWLSGPLSTWYGVTVTNYRVTVLDLNTNNLYGSIPAEIGDLTSLVYLYLNHNQLTGEIPSEIGNMSNLYYLYLGYNQLSGSIPSSVTNLTELFRLQLFSNQLTDIPDLSSLDELQYIYAQYNRFTFEDIEPNMGIPNFYYSPQANIGESQSFKLNVGDDHLMSVTCGGDHNLYQWFRDGVTIPGATGSNYQITYADFTDIGVYTCQVTNTIATGLTITSNPVTIDVIDPGTQLDSLALVDLYLSTDGDNWTNRTNWLTGPLSLWYGVTLNSERVSTLDLDDNNLNGNISPQIGDLDMLTGLYLRSNLLSSSIPSEISNLTNLRYLYLDNNQLAGNIPADIGNLTSLITCSLSNNNLGGVIPSSIGNLLNMTAIALDHNQLEGPIPAELYNLTKLTTIYLHNNQISGNISGSIGNLTKLRYLRLNDNQFTGPLPDELGQLTDMMYLYLDDNQFTGAIPGGILNMSNLTYLLINNNQFTDLPDLSSLLNLTYLYIYGNHLTFEDIEPNMGVAAYFVYIPQANIGSEQDVYVPAEDDYTLSVECGGANNSYQWYKNNVAVTGALSAEYTIADLDYNDEAEYKCRIRNSIVTGLTIYSNPVRLHLLPPGWGYDSTAYTHNCIIDAKVIIDGQEATNGWLAAFVGDECRGIDTSFYHGSTDSYLFEVSCVSNSTGGEMLTFRYWDPVSDSIYDLQESYEFIPDLIIGSPEEPEELHSFARFSKALQEGWNWFSVNVSVEDMSLENLLSGCAADEDYIKNMTQSATYYQGYGWYGTLTHLDPRVLYMFRSGSNCGIDISGTSPDVGANPIAINSGWNWIGYLPRVAMPIDEALSSLSVSELDYIKNQTSSATYYDGFGWYGNLTDLYPGEGYKCKILTAGTLIYPEGGAAAFSSKSSVPQYGISPEFSVNQNDFEFNGSVSAMISPDEKVKVSEKDILYAFKDKACVGMVQGKYFEPTGLIVFPLMIFSDTPGGDRISFVYYSSEYNRYYPCDESLTFDNDMIIASAFNPFVLNISGTVDHEEDFFEMDPSLAAYPNPFSDRLNIEYCVHGSSYVRLEVYDIFGRVVDVLVNGHLESGSYLDHLYSDSLPEGTYFIKLTTGEKQLIKRINLVK